jgi:hypothetical protein
VLVPTLLIGIPRAEVGPYVRLVVLAVLLIKGIQILVKKDTRTEHIDFLVAVMPALLAAFLSIDHNLLKSIEIFPVGQDSLEYQIAARNIYVGGDILLSDSPPRVYKFLFPYLVGLMHLLFGQSSAALFFLNPWCAGLTAWLMLKILSVYRVSRWLGYTAVLALLTVLTGPLFFVFYFRFGLIEPVATLLLVYLLFAALAGIPWQYFLSGAALALLRLDYLGAALPAFLLTGEAMRGSYKQAIDRLVVFARRNWKTGLIYLVCLIALPLILMIYYSLIAPGYEIRASDTRYASAVEALGGVLKVISGGSLAEIQAWLAAYPLDTLLMLLILYGGIVVVLISLFVRTRPFTRVDIRLSLVVVGFLLVYLFFSPTGYAPRFSTPLLPLVLMVSANVVQQVVVRNVENGRVEK